MNYSDLQYLSVPLPEDLSKLKGFGDFARMERVIDKKLQNAALPKALRARLELEKELIRRLPDEYPYSVNEALQQLRECFGEFSEEELDELRDADAVEWAYMNGEPKFFVRFLSNLVMTRKAYADRLTEAGRAKYPSGNKEQRIAAIRKMKAQGTLNMRLHIKSTMLITPDEAHKGQPVTAYLPIPIPYAQVENVQILDISPKDTLIAPKEHPQRTAIFRAVPSDIPFSVEYTYETHMRYVEPDPACVADSQPTFYTEELPPHIRFTPYLRSLAAEIIGEEKNPLVKARKIYDFVTTKAIYSLMREYYTMPMITEFIGTSLKGDCGVQALLFITLCRIAGVPARWQSGLYTEPGDVGSHDWAQFYIAPYGWLFADPSFGGGGYRDGDMERWNFYFGNLDPYRMPANSEYQHEFYVPTRFMRYDPYDNQQGEAEYQDAPVARRDCHVTHELLECTEI